MIEIDGEFFEDPCETIRAGRQIVAIMAAQTAIVQIKAILAQPLFPPSHEGGIIVRPSENPLAGDWVIGVDPGAPEGDRSI